MWFPLKHLSLSQPFTYPRVSLPLYSHIRLLLIHSLSLSPSLFFFFPLHTAVVRFSPYNPHSTLGLQGKMSSIFISPLSLYLNFYPSPSLSISIFDLSFCLHLFDDFVPHFLGITHMICIQMFQWLQGSENWTRTHNPPSRCSQTRLAR